MPKPEFVSQFEADRTQRKTDAAEAIQARADARHPGKFIVRVFRGSVRIDRVKGN